jgi:hypothetical protein
MPRKPEKRAFGHWPSDPVQKPPTGKRAAEADADGPSRRARSASEEDTDAVRAELERVAARRAERESLRDPSAPSPDGLTPARPVREQLSRIAERHDVPEVVERMEAESEVWERVVRLAGDVLRNQQQPGNARSSAARPNVPRRRPPVR